MTEQTLVNMTFKVNNSKIRREKRSGRDVIIVPSATLPDNVVMNGIMYPAAEIDAGYESLHMAPAPYGHPQANEKFVSARTPEGINMGWIGAHNENPRREGGRVLVDKVIDVEVAESTPRGRRVLEAINEEKPIHTSTGIICKLHACSSGGAEKEARDIFVDHDAFLLYESGAATPDQGVGVFVNSSGVEMEVINSFSDEVEREIEWASETVLRALEKKGNIPMLERIKSVLMGVFPEGQNNSETEEGEAEMADQDLSKLSAQLENMQESITKSLDGLGDTITNAMKEGMKPVSDQLESIQNAAKQADEQKRTTLVNKLIKVNMFEDADEAKDIPLATLENMVDRHCTKGKAAGINNATSEAEAEDEFKDVDLNANRKTEED